MQLGSSQVECNLSFRHRPVKTIFGRLRGFGMIGSGFMRTIALSMALGLAAAPLAAQVAELSMLDTLSPGTWEFRLRPEGTRRSICVRNGRDFIQLQHRQTGCARFVIQDDQEEVIVQYTCRGDGYGRTTIRKEGSGLVQLRSQGSQGGTPFSIEGEARRTGSC